MTQACDIGRQGSSALLSQGDPAPFRVLNKDAGADFLIVCDHAGRRVPERLGRLGASADVFDRHVALDIGAEGVACRLAERLNAPAVLQTYSRLVVDCNRHPTSESAIPRVSDGVAIPGNEGLTLAQRQARHDELFAPYHAAIAAELDRLGPAAVLVSIHSFTPEMAGVVRPWAFGVIHDGRSAVSRAMLRLLREAVDAPVGDNEPYAMDGVDFTVPHHAGRRDLDYLELEIRQDLIADEAGQQRAAELLVRLLPLALRA